MAVPPEYAVPEEHLVPISDFPRYRMKVPPSRMFIIKEALKTYRQNHESPWCIPEWHYNEGAKIASTYG